MPSSTDLPELLVALGCAVGGFDTSGGFDSFGFLALRRVIAIRDYKVLIDVIVVGIVGQFRLAAALLDWHCGEVFLDIGRWNLNSRREPARGKDYTTNGLQCVSM